MSTDQPPAMPPLPENRRKPPTIDLEATEVEARPAADTATAPESAPEPAQESAQEPPPSAKTSPAEPPPPPPPPPRRSVAALIGSGIVGGAIAAGGLVAAHLYLAGPNSVDARLAGVEQRLRDLAARPWPAAGGAIGTDTRALDELTARLAKLEAAVANPRPAQLDPAVANRVSAIEGEIKAMAESVGVLNRRSDEAVATAREARARADATAAALTELAAKLDRTAKAFEAALAKQQPGADRPGRLAIAAAVLETTVARGAPFASELAAVKTLGADPQALAALEPFAAAGLPSVNTLAREMSDLAPMLTQASAGPAREGGGLLERLQSGAERLVRIRRVEEVTGSDPAAIIARVEFKAVHGDIAGALAELASLPEGVRAPAAAWIKKAQARAAALDASRKLAADSLVGLGK
jgi:hypothetical protein